MLEIGTKAPDFELPDQNGEMHKLSDYAGKNEYSVAAKPSVRKNGNHLSG